MRQFVTGADSASIVMGGLSENGTTDPSRFTVVFWGVATGGVASAMLLRHSLANQVLVDSVTTAVTTANEPHEVETIKLHTRLSSTAGNDDGDDEDAEDGIDETTKDLRGDGRAVDGADGRPESGGRGLEDCSWCWGAGSWLGPQLLDGGAHLACGVIDDDDVAVG
ncbi:BCCT family transporter [Actinomyces oris]|uniref:BCCT family transporter n=1 Tax=Actinomyces oris TaxID=544580 RepID=UPI003D2EE855